MGRASLVIDLHGGIVSIGFDAFSSPSLDHAFGSAFVEIFLIAHFFVSDLRTVSTSCSMRISFPFAFHHF